MQPKTKLLAVESVRGVACFMVVLSHLGLAFFPFLHSFGDKADPMLNPIQSFIHESPFGFFYSGTSAVFIFFVLSGFILTKVALREGSKPTKIVSMGIKRYPRLMIPALASCLLAYAFFILFDITNPHLNDWIHDYGSRDYSLYGAIYSGTLDVFFFSGESLYNPVLWTMKIELLGSFIIYLLCVNRLTLRIPLLVGLAFLLTVGLTVSGSISHNLGLGLSSFYGGYLFGIYGKQISNLTATLIAVVGLYLAGAHNSSASYAYIYTALKGHTYLLCNFVSGFFIVYAIVFNNRLNSLFSGRVSVFMGKVSFSVYLIHMPILATVGVFSFNYFFNHSGAYIVSAILASVTTIVSVYVCSMLFYRVVDLQGMNISDWIAKRTIAQMQNFYKALSRTPG